MNSVGHTDNSMGGTQSIDRGAYEQMVKNITAAHPIRRSSKGHAE